MSHKIVYNIGQRIVIYIHFVQCYTIHLYPKEIFLRKEKEEKVLFKLNKKVISSMLVAFLLTGSVFGNDVTAQALAMQAETNTVVKVDSEQVAANNYGLVGDTEGNILHAWDWKFADVTANMQAIAESGYSDVQVSPCQVIRENVTNNSSWWQFYQPTDFVFGNSLGSKEEFKAMCEEAHKYGVHIIVDIVSNHLAGSDLALDGLVADKWKNNTGQYFHKYGQDYKANDDNDRERMVTGTIGMPDLNTENTDVQNSVKEYLGELMDMGADGFRFDAAKHIGTPSDNGNSKSNYWEVIANYVRGKNPNALLYGEILNDIPVSIDYYTPYIKVTESQKGWDMKDLVKGSNLTQALAFNYTRTTGAKNLITWVESHDTYCNANQETGTEGTDNYMDNNAIKLAWSTVAARADAQSLFFARPAGIIGQGSGSNRTVTVQGSLGINTNDSTWKSKEVAAVNKFKNAMVGQGESCSTSGNVAIIKRGNKGVVATNFGSNEADFNVSGLSGLQDGTYTDASGQNGSFTVSGGNVSGKIKGKTFVVLYDESSVVLPTDGPTDAPTPTVSTTPSTDTTITFSKDSSSFEAAFDVTIKVENVEYAYYSYDGAEWTQIKDGTAKVTIGTDAANNGDAYGLFVHAKGNDGKNYDESKTYTYKKAGVVSGEYTLKVRAAKSEFSEAPYVYFYEGSSSIGAEWPGTKMTAEGDYWVFTSNTMTSGNAVFSDDNGWQDPLMDAGAYEVSGCMEYSKSAGKVTPFTEETGTPSGSAKPVKTPAAFTIDISSPEVPATEAPTPDLPGNPVIKTSLENGSNFYDDTAEVELRFENTVSASYTVDNGPVQQAAIDANSKTAKVVVGMGKIADTDVTLKVTAKNAQGVTAEETYTYHKVFVKKASVVNTMSTFASEVMNKIKETGETVNAAAETDAYYATNPDGKVGKEATITGASDFTQDMLIARSGAWDVPNAFNGAHENSVADCYGLYAAWDNDNLYIGLEMVNTTDTWHGEGDGPLSDGGKMSDVPVVIAINTGAGNAMTGKCPTDKEGHVWQCNLEFETRIDHLLFASAKGTGNPGLFTGDAEGNTDYTEHLTGFKDAGITYTIEDKSISPEIMQMVEPKDPSEVYDSSKYKDAMSQGHDRKYDTFFTYTIPLKALNIDKAYIESNGVGIMGLGTRQSSALDCIPHDPSMLDNAMKPYTIADDNTSHEKEDLDIITVPLAAAGNIKGGGSGGDIPITNTPQPPTSAPSTDTPSTDTPGTDIPSTDTPSTDNPISDDTAYCVNFGADRSAPQYNTTELTLSAVPYNGKAPYTYAFSVDGAEVQNSAQDSYKWKGTEGNHTIKVVVTDAEGKTVGSEKQYIIAAEGQDIPQITSEPTGAPTETVPTAAVPTTPIETAPAVPTASVVPTTPIETAPAVPTASVVPTASADTNPTEVPTITLPPSADPGVGTTEGTKKEGLVITEFSTNPLSTQELGKSVTLKTEVAGGTGSIKYTYIVAKKDNADDMEVIAHDTTDAAVTWTAKEAGSYILYVMVADDNEDGDYAALNYTITAVPTPTQAAPTAQPKALKVKTLKVTTAKKNRVVKKKIKVKATVSNKQGTVKYKFAIKRKGAKKKTVIRKYSTKKTATFKVTKKGTYHIYVYAKDSRNKIKTKSIKITIKKK